METACLIHLSTTHPNLMQLTPLHSPPFHSTSSAPCFLSLSQVKSVLVLMPATSANVLRLLLEVCHYVNTNSAVTEMDALVRSSDAMA